MSSIRPADAQASALISALGQNDSTDASDANDAQATTDVSAQAAAAASAGRPTAANGAVTFDASSGQFVLAPAVASTTPALPQAKEQTASPVAAGASLSAVGNMGYGLPSGVMAFGIIWEAMQKTQGLYARTKTASQQAANNSAVTGALANLKEVEAKRSESVQKFVAQIGGAAAGLGANFAGPNFAGTAQSIGNLVPNAFDAINQNVGAGRDASDAQIAKSQADVQKTMSQQLTDGQDGAKKQMEQALEQTVSLLQEFYRRQSDTMKAIAS